MTTYPTLRRDGIDSLDEALYAASCFAASAPDRTVTIMGATHGDGELYQITDGETGPWRDNVAGLDWWPEYVIRRPTQAGR